MADIRHQHGYFYEKDGKMFFHFKNKVTNGDIQVNYRSFKSLQNGCHKKPYFYKFNPERDYMHLPCFL